MTFFEERGDLFAEEIISEYALCHCISADFALGAGLAKAVAKMGVKKALLDNYPREWRGRGYCLITQTNGVVVGNLVTKERYFHKPFLESLRQALEDFRGQALEMELKKIAMPKIGCGLDMLRWEDVCEVIKEVFRDTDNDILVRFLA